MDTVFIGRIRVRSMGILTDVNKEAYFCDIENRLCSVGTAYQYE
jgi:hypothetical protein